MQKGNKLIGVVLCCCMLAGSPAFAKQDTFTLHFVDEDIRVILHTISTISGTDMVVDDSIKGNLSLNLDNVSFEQAMQLLTAAKGISYRQVGTAVIVEPGDFGVNEVITLEHVKAADVKKTLDSVAGNWKVKTELSEIGNQLVLTGPPNGIARAKDTISKLDIPSKQIMLEAQVVAINKTDLKDLGIDWSWEKLPMSANYERDAVSTQTPVKNDDGTWTTVTTQTNSWKVTRNYNQGVIQFGRNPEGHPYEFYYQAKLSALISKGNAKILAKPKVMTLNGREARILIGDHIPVITEKTQDGKTTTTVEYVDSGIKLRYTPSVTADGSILATVHTEVSTPTLVTDIKNYRITTREAESFVRMKEGETLIIGGLIGTEQSEGNNKVPFLGDLPIIGKLFSSVHNNKTETEVVIFLTAKIVP